MVTVVEIRETARSREQDRINLIADQLWVKEILSSIEKVDFK